MRVALRMLETRDHGCHPEASNEGEVVEGLIEAPPVGEPETPAVGEPQETADGAAEEDDAARSGAAPVA
jgi:hypothetical protein